METEFKRTTDHEAIRAWVVEHDGAPIYSAGANAEEVIDIGFGPSVDESLQISWDEFFERLDTNGLAFRYTQNVIRGQEKLSYSFVAANSPSDTSDDETELPEDNEVAEENINNSFSGDE